MNLTPKNNVCYYIRVKQRKQSKGDKANEKVHSRRIKTIVK